jgi:hypothetical protein
VTFNTRTYAQYTKNVQAWEQEDKEMFENNVVGALQNLLTHTGTFLTPVHTDARDTDSLGLIRQRAVGTCMFLYLGMCV